MAIAERRSAARSVMMFLSFERSKTKAMERVLITTKPAEAMIFVF